MSSSSGPKEDTMQPISQCEVISLEAASSQSPMPRSHAGRWNGSEQAGKPRPAFCECGDEIQPEFFDGGWRFRGRCPACEKAAKARRLKAAIESAKVPLRQRGLSWDDGSVEVYDARACAILALQELRVDGCVVLMGATGTGKSALAACCAMDWVRKARRVRWLTEEDYLALLRPNGAGVGDLYECDLVVLDDLGSGSSTEWARFEVEQLVCRRYDACQALVITTNLDLDGIVKRYGERVVSRLEQMAGEDGWCVVAGRDRRKA